MKTFAWPFAVAFGLALSACGGAEGGGCGQPETPEMPQCPQGSTPEINTDPASKDAIPYRCKVAGVTNRSTAR